MPLVTSAGSAPLLVIDIKIRFHHVNMKRPHRPTGLWWLGRHPVASWWISCSGALDSSESRGATHLLWLCVCWAAPKTQAQFWFWWPRSECVLHLVLPLTPPSPTSLLFLSSLSMTSVKRTSLPESFPSTRAERRASRRPATWSVSTGRRGEAGGAAAGLSVRPSDRQAGRLVSDRKRSQQVVGPHLVQSPHQTPPTPILPMWSQTNHPPAMRQRRHLCSLSVAGAQ